MATNESERSTFLLVFDAHNGKVRLMPECEPIVDAHVARYLEGGCTRDELLHLTMISGVFYHTRVSDILSWCLSTPGSRRAEEVLERELEKKEWQDSE